MYTKEIVEENRQVNARAKELLGSATGLTKEYPHIMEKLYIEFPDIPKNRVKYQVAKVLRANYGKKVIID